MTDQEHVLTGVESGSWETEMTYNPQQDQINQNMIDRNTEMVLEVECSCGKTFDTFNQEAIDHLKQNQPLEKFSMPDLAEMLASNHPALIPCDFATQSGQIKKGGLVKLIEHEEISVPEKYQDSEGRIDENQLADDIDQYLDEENPDISAIVGEFMKRIEYR